MQVNPRDRPNAGEAARHQFLAHGGEEWDEALWQSATAVVAPCSVSCCSSRNGQVSSCRCSSRNLCSSSFGSSSSSHALIPLHYLGQTDFVDHFGVRSPPRSPAGRASEVWKKKYGSQSSPENRPRHFQEGHPSPDSRTSSLKGTPCSFPPRGPSLSPTGRNRLDSATGSIPKMSTEPQRSMGPGIVDDANIDVSCAKTSELNHGKGKESPTGLGLKGATSRMSKISSPMPQPKISSPMPQLPIYAKPGATTRQFSVAKRGANGEFECKVQPELELRRLDFLHKGLGMTSKVAIDEPNSRLFEDLLG